MLPIILGAIGAVISVIVAYNLEKKSPRWLRYSLVIGSLLTVISVVWSAIQQNIEQQKILNLTKEQNSLLTGGDSFVYVQFYPKSKLIGVIPVGKYPVYDVRLMISDPDKTKPVDFRTATLRDVLSLAQTVEVGNISPNFPRFDWYYDLGSNKSKNLSVQIFARNGSYIQSIKLRTMKDGTWSRAWRVRDVRHPEKLLMQHVDPDFPEINKGKVEWTNNE